MRTNNQIFASLEENVNEMQTRLDNFVKDMNLLAQDFEAIELAVGLTKKEDQ